MSEGRGLVRPRTAALVCRRELGDVAESPESGKTVNLVARRRRVSRNQLFIWRRLAEHGALTATQAEEEVVPASAFRAQQEQNRELRPLLGKKTPEVEILREALDVAADSK